MPPSLAATPARGLRSLVRMRSATCNVNGANGRSPPPLEWFAETRHDARCRHGSNGEARTQCELAKAVSAKARRAKVQRMDFRPAILPPTELTALAWCFAFMEGELLLPEGAEVPTPGPLLEAPVRHYLGRLGELDAWAIRVESVPQGWRRVPLRAAMMAMAKEFSQLKEASQIDNFLAGSTQSPAKRASHSETQRAGSAAAKTGKATAR